MVKSISSKRILEFALAIVATVVVFFAFGVSASAKTYKAIQIDVPRISQRPGTGDCAIASMATIEAYCHGLPSGNYNSAAYQAVYSTNGYTISASWPKLGYKPIDSFSMQTLYNQLETGYPVIVHRTSSHYSVVYGYDGNTSALELSGFKVVDVDDSYNSTTAYKRLDKWKGSTSIDRMVVRLNGIAIPAITLKINGNHPAESTPSGTKFTPYGMVTSGSSITNVTVAVSNSAGKAVQTYSATPKAKSFSLSQASGKIDISALQTGSYIYSVYAKNSLGETKTAKYGFGIGSASAPNVNDNTDVPKPLVITKVSYKVVIKADPSLNIRKSADINSEKITSIPYGEIVDITAECNGWGLASYKGYAGWISLNYTEKYNEANTKPIVDPVVNPEIPVPETIRYARVTTATSLKRTKFIFASNVVSVPKNAILTVISSESGWLKVLYNGKEGYIASSLCIARVFDIDFNGVVNSSDALIVLEASIGKRKLSASEIEVADSNGDGVVNSSDALTILAVATGEKKY